MKYLYPWLTKFLLVVFVRLVLPLISAMVRAGVVDVFLAGGQIIVADRTWCWCAPMAAVKAEAAEPPRLFE